MRKSPFLAALVLLLGLSAQAQEYPRREYPQVEIFGGFSYLGVDAGAYEREHAYGFQASVAGNLTRHFGLVGEVSSQYKFLPSLVAALPIDFTAHEYLAGPRVSIRGEKVTGFAHALFGGASASVNFLGLTFSRRAFATAFGGGVDVNVNDRIAVRAVQADYLPSRFFDAWQHNIRLGFGIVFKVANGS